MHHSELKRLLDSRVQRYNQPGFIADDPVCIPHRFSKPADIEIAGLFAALLAWGNRKTIIQSCNKLLLLLNNQPYQTIVQTDFSSKVAKPFMQFVHRTFNGSDLLHLLQFLQYHYAVKKEKSLETAFSNWLQPGDATVENALVGFHDYVFNPDFLFEERTRKHIATPAKKSACKRLNMYLRWMVRQDDKGVDFGLWKRISPAQLICPLDVHVARVARSIGLLYRTQNDWQAAMELTEQLRRFSAADPVQYDFALFGMGVVEKHV